MGYLERRDVIKIRRNHVYLVTMTKTKPFEEEIVRAYTTLEQAKNYIKEYEKRHRSNLHSALNKQGERYSWFEDEFGFSYYLRITAYELDCEYDEDTYIIHNP